MVQKVECDIVGILVTHDTQMMWFHGYFQVIFPLHDLPSMSGSIAFRHA
jgi:hypothetical protein